MGKAFAKLRAAGAKALWRFAYDRAMPGEHYYTAETILGHIAQLRAPFSKQYDALYVLQAGFIGSWGEWHSSQTNLHANASALLAACSDRPRRLTTTFFNKIFKQKTILFWSWPLPAACSDRPRRVKTVFFHKI